VEERPLVQRVRHATAYVDDHLSGSRPTARYCRITPAQQRHGGAVAPAPTAASSVRVAEILGRDQRRDLNKLAAGFLVELVHDDG
jgi:hypothetical protein